MSSSGDDEGPPPLPARGGARRRRPPPPFNILLKLFSNKCASFFASSRPAQHNSLLTPDEKATLNARPPPPPKLGKIRHALCRKSLAQLARHWGTPRGSPPSRPRARNRFLISFFWQICQKVLCVRTRYFMTNISSLLTRHLIHYKSCFILVLFSHCTSPPRATNNAKTDGAGQTKDRGGGGREAER